MGDTTITANRSVYVDFTLPYTDMGIGMIVPIDQNNNMWIFLKPLKPNLWLTIAALFVLTGFVVWIIERPVNDEFQGSRAHQFGMIFWYSFSTLVFSQSKYIYLSQYKYACDFIYITEIKFYLNEIIFSAMTIPTGQDSLDNVK